MRVSAMTRFSQSLASLVGFWLVAGEARLQVVVFGNDGIVGRLANFGQFSG